MTTEGAIQALWVLGGMAIAVAAILLLAAVIVRLEERQR